MAEKELAELKLKRLKQSTFQGLEEYDNEALYFTNPELNEGLIAVDANGNIINKEVVNSVTSTATDKPLSANMGKELADQITNLSALGRFLSTWNCATGKPATNPVEMPYAYKTGDYYMVNNLGTGTKYKPNGSSYTGAASTTVETGDVSINDFYVYDGTNWTVLFNTRKEVTFSGISGNPTDNTNLATALGTKLEGVQVAGTDLTKDANNKVNIPLASGSDIGAVKVNPIYGIGSYGYPNGYIYVLLATDSEIEAKTSQYKPVTPKNLDKAVMEGLGNNSLTWSDAYKQSARNTIGAGTGNTTVNIIEWTE